MAAFEDNPDTGGIEARPRSLPDTFVVRSPVMGFAATAAHFEDRARHERDDERKADLLEVAGFYRSLAGIATDMPPGFHPKSQYGYADRWRARADECRAMADQFQDAKCRAQMI